MGSRLLFPLGTALVLAGVALVSGMAGQTGTATALSFEPPRADVVFSNGGRILTMKADGRGREVLFGKKRNPSNDGLGAIEPAVSPDGEKVVFGFRRQARYESLIDIWVMNSDGSGARKLLASTRKQRYGDPGFGPDGRIVAALFGSNKRRAIARIFSMKDDGTNRRPLFSLKQRLRPWVGWKSLAEPSVSADGSKLLYLLDPGFDGTFYEGGYGSELRVMNIATGKHRNLAGDALSGTWSPDGKKVAFGQVDSEGEDDFCWNADYACHQFSRVMVIRADGTGPRRLTNGKADERHPDWSADGRIIFQSARGAKSGIAETTEVWSVRPDGSCLTRLTNGSPASLAPVWSGSEGTSAPAGCGVKPPGPNPEVGPAGNPANHFWFGPSFRNVMLSGVDDESAGSEFSYGDCGAIPASKCGREVVIYNEDICRARGYTAVVIGSGGARQRGVPLLRSLKPGRETPAFTMGISGRTLFFLIGGSGVGDRGQQHRREIDAMRQVGSGAAGPVEGDLPAPRIPSGDVRQMKQIKRVYERTGSVPGTARRLNRSRYIVRLNLRFARKFEAVGGYRTVNCPSRK